MFKKIITIAISCIMLSAFAAHATITDDVKRTVDEIIRIVTDKDMKQSANQQKRRAAIKKSIADIFDHREMARRSLGKHWKNLTAAEQQQFVTLFSSLLENSYAGKIESYNNEKVIYIKETVDGDKATLKSKVITPKNDEFTLDYSLVKESNGKWMVYDVIIEGVSLVSNYRTQFNKIITANGYPALVKKLQNKNNELKMQ